MQLLSPTSYWHHTAPETFAHYPPLPGNVQVDVAVIGAGITGLTAAAKLKAAGKRVAVLEAGQIGNGTSGGTSAHLTTMLDTDLSQPISDFGEESVRHVIRGCARAIDLIEERCRRWNTDNSCGFERVTGYLYSENPRHRDWLHKQCDAAYRLGISATMTENVPLPFRTDGGIRVENQGRFHSIRYLQHLAEELHDGEQCSIYEQTRAEVPESGSVCKIETDHGTVTADAVIEATHSGYLGVSQLDFRVAPYQSYCLAVLVEETVPDALFWDDADPYHYTRRAAGSNPHLLIIGGADHKTGQGRDEREHVRQLEQYVRERFTVRSVEHRWSAEFFEPADGLPLIGRMPLHKNVYAATGFSGTGLTFGTMAGELIAGQILGRKSPLDDIVSPARFKPLAAGPTLAKENLNVVRHFVADRFGTPSIESPDEVRAGEGRLVKWQGKQVALYRDSEGTLHTLSPVCTHAGCIVHWNQAEQTWDCPCHGGRYSAVGERIYGPPPADLKHHDPPPS